MEAQSDIMSAQRDSAAESARAAAAVVTLTENQQAILEQQHAAIIEQGTLLKHQLAVAQQSADAAKASADALKIVHRQWLQVGAPAFSMQSLGVTGTLNVTLHIPVRNTSQLPLTIRTVRCYINAGKCGHAWSNKTLGPNEVSEEEVFYLLRPDEKARWEKDQRLRLIVAGWIHFWDAFNDPQEQMIGACYDINKTVIDVRGLADLPRNLGRMARENPWPFTEPDDSETHGNKQQGQP